MSIPSSLTRKAYPSLFSKKVHILSVVFVNFPSDLLEDLWDQPKWSCLSPCCDVLVALGWMWAGYFWGSSSAGVVGRWWIDRTLAGRPAPHYCYCKPSVSMPSVIRSGLVIPWDKDMATYREIGRRDMFAKFISQLCSATWRLDTRYEDDSISFGSRQRF